MYFLIFFSLFIPSHGYLSRSGWAETAVRYGRDQRKSSYFELRERKGFNIKALWQHRAASDVSGSRYESLSRLEVPTLVIHGTEDMVFHIDHGKKLAELIPGAEALFLEGEGHVFPYPKMGNIHARILSHLAMKG